MTSILAAMSPASARHQLSIQPADGPVDQLRELARERPALLLLGLLAMAVATILATCSVRVRLVGMTAVMYLATLARPDATPWYSLELTPGLQLLSDYSRVLSVAVLAVLAAAGVLSARRSRHKLVPAAIVALLCFELLNCAKTASGGNYLLALNCAGVFTLIALAVPIGIGKLLRGPDDVHAVLMAVLGASVLVMIGTLYELAVRPGAVLNGAHPRLYGTMGHPQKMGMLGALTAPIAIYMAIAPTRYRWASPLFVVVAVLAFASVGASGSRTAALALATGGGILLRRSRYIGVFAAAAALLVGALIVTHSDDLAHACNRLLSTANTRADPWSKMLGQFVANPVFGADYSGKGSAESSYLGAAARMGIVGVAAVGSLALLIGLCAWRLCRARRSLGEHSLLANLLAGGLCAMVVACVFDAYLFDTITFFILYLYVYLTLGAAVLYYAR